MTIEVICEIDDELVLDHLDQGFHEMLEGQKSTPYPKTFEAIFMLQMNINFLKTGIFEVARDDNPYAISVLQRSLYEHAVRHLYLFTRFVVEKSDSPGLDYYKWTDIKEYLDYFTSLKKEAELKNDPIEALPIDEILSEIYAGYSDLSKSEKREKFSGLSFYSMLRSVLSDLLKGREGVPMLSNLPTDYMILSSFVHGGPHANRLVGFNALNPDQRARSIYNSCKMAFFFSCITLVNTFIFAGQTDKKLLKYVPIVREYSTKVPDFEE